MFIDNIKFNENENENFHPFNKDCEIKFLGEEEIQKLISFYKDDKIAKKFKINCILANNGGGKSRFFEIFKKHFIDTSMISGKDEEEVLTIEDKNGKIISKNDYEVILDDFFVLSKSKDFSINREILKLGYEGFYLQTYNFLNKQEKLGDIKIFSEFIHADLENEDGYSIEISFPKGFTGNIYDTKLQELRKYKWTSIKEEDYDRFINNIYNYDGFGSTITEYGKENDLNNIKELFKLENFDIIFLFTSGILSEILDISCGIKNEGQYNISHYHDLIPKNAKNYVLIEKILERKKAEKELKKLLKQIYKIWNNIDFNIKYKKLETNFTDTEIRFLSTNFHINLRFKLQNGEEKNYKSFEDLSGGEKCMLSRFTNIYMEIINSTKSNFIILIDEPDLHLHLDWQRQYIQKLIDIFSTINKDIKMHFILATHSPFIVSDLPSESIVLLQNGKQKPYDGQTFGANYVDLIRDGFFFENQVLMGSFSADIIRALSLIEKFKLLKGHINIESLKEEEKEIYLKYVQNQIYGDVFFEDIKKQIGDEFLRDNLLYFKT